MITNKSILLILIILFVSNISFSQTEWITEIPVLGEAYSMIRTEDSCYAVLKCPIYYNDDSTDYFFDLQLSKVNSQGEVLWYKTIFSDTLDFSDLSFIQLSNEDYFITGNCYWCPFYAVASKDGELKVFNRLEYYFGSVSCFRSPIQIYDNEIWVLGGFTQMYTTKINIANNTVEVDSSSLCIQNAFVIKRLTESKILIVSSPFEIYELDTSQNLINQSSYNYMLYNPLYNPMHFNQFDSLYYFYVKSLDPYPNEHYGFLILNQQLDSVGFIDNIDFYPNQSQLEYPRVLDFDFPKAGSICMTGFLFWYPGMVVELPYIQTYNYLEDSVEYFHAYVGSTTKYSINLIRDGNSYVMLHMFSGYPGLVFLVKELTDTCTTNILNETEIADFNVYPNPISELLIIEGNEISFNSIIIYNNFGQVVYEAEFEDTFYKEVFTKNWANGTYHIRVDYDNQSIIKTFLKL